MSKPRYHVVECDGIYGVMDGRAGKKAAPVYDMIETRTEAEAICKVLSKSRQRDWDDIAPLVKAEMESASKSPAAEAPADK